MKILFEKTTIGGITSKNRIVRSATQEGLAVNGGQIGKELISVYKTLSEGGVGIIITAMAGVDENSRVFPLMVKAYDDGFVNGLRKIVNTVHDNDCRIVVQLAHNGAKGNPDKGNPPLAPSDMELGGKEVRSMTKEEIKGLADSFALAALRCKKAGADGVQIHGAHGYLLSQFLSPFFNKRTDEYGGCLANRAKIVFEVYDAVRSAVGDSFPVWIKINCDDFADGGLTADESLWVCRQLDKRGINGIEVSGGIGVSSESAPTRFMSNRDRGTFSEYAVSIAGEVNATVISVGGYRTPDMMEKWINKGNIEAISLCRPLICEPEIPNIWKSGDRRKSKCISCNKCFDYASGFGCQLQRSNRYMQV